MKEEALDHTVWRTGFGRGCGPVIRQATESINMREVTLYGMSMNFKHYVYYVDLPNVDMEMEWEN